MISPALINFDDFLQEIEDHFERSLIREFHALVILRGEPKAGASRLLREVLDRSQAASCLLDLRSPDTTPRELTSKVIRALGISPEPRPVINNNTVDLSGSIVKDANLNVSFDGVGHGAMSDLGAIATAGGRGLESSVVAIDHLSLCNSGVRDFVRSHLLPTLAAFRGLHVILADCDGVAIAEEARQHRLELEVPALGLEHIKQHCRQHGFGIEEQIQEALHTATAGRGGDLARMLENLARNGALGHA